MSVVACEVLPLPPMVPTTPPSPTVRWHGNPLRRASRSGPPFPAVGTALESAVTIALISITACGFSPSSYFDSSHTVTDSLGIHGLGVLCWGLKERDETEPASKPLSSKPLDVYSQSLVPCVNTILCLHVMSPC